MNPAGIVYKNTLHIFGGQRYYGGRYTILISTEIINEDGTVVRGVNLPIPLYEHAIGKGYT